ncbi:MAG TPA: CBS domain-containing protein [Terriglobales bacterium]|jgi:CBS domain-containing protein/sporulation protein YlmC with PRC-barrel domain
MATQAIPLSELLGSRVNSPDGALIGRVREVAMSPQHDPQHVSALIVRTKSGSDRLLSPRRLSSLTRDQVVTKSTNAEELPALVSSEGMLFLDRDLLDQQIIDVHGRKVVRVNDALLNVENGTYGLQLRMSEVETGTRGAVRRLLKGLVPRTALDSFADKFAPKVIPWQFVDLIEIDPARRVRLKIDQERLAKLHPADIADILEELAPAEREAVFSNLDEDVAAEALEELDPKMQASLLSSITSDHAADIVEEMDPDAAADVLGELTPEQSSEILEEMEPEEREEVSELLAFEEDTAAGRMTTDFVWTYEDLTVANAIDVLRKYEGQSETINTIFLVDDDERLTGAVPLNRLVLAPPHTRLSDVKQEPLIFCEPDANESEVAELFDKYNLLMLPVLDNERRIAGVITADDVISILRRKL